MRKFILISASLTISALTISGCATTKPRAQEVQVVQIEVRPIETSTEKVVTKEFDAAAALIKAKLSQASADFAASYEAYSVVLMRMGTEHDDRDKAILGLADSALALNWRGADYGQKARKFYETLVNKEELSEANTNRAMSGLLLLDLPDFTPKAAVKRLVSALENSPDDARLWNALGKTYDGEGAWLDALDAYINALTAAKTNGQNTGAVVNNIGMSLLMQGRKTEALEKFKQALKANPGMSVYDNNLRLAQTLSGKTDTALKGLSDTRAAQIYNDAGVIAQSQGNTEKAVNLYKKAVETSPIYFELAEQNLAGLQVVMDDAQQPQLAPNNQEPA